MAIAKARTHSDQLIVESLDFLRRIFSVSAAMFYWIEPDLDTVNGPALDLPPGLADRYRTEMRHHDPLLASRLVDTGQMIAELSREARHVPEASWRDYITFLDAYRVVDNLDFVFWMGDRNCRRAFAGASLLRMADDPPFPDDREKLETLHHYVGFNIQGHERIRRERQHHVLRHQMGLTEREYSICELIAVGATNRDIADCLGLTQATVKTYIRAIFDKAGVETRTALAARIATLA